MTINTKVSATDFIPHEKPMIFIDHVLEFGDDFAVAELLITPELMFCDVQGLPTWASIELMAQTISLYAGSKGQQLGHTPKIGFLLGTRKLHLPIAYFECGKTVKITARRQYLHEGLGQFCCEIQYEDHTIQAMLSVYEPVELSESKRVNIENN
ncbi:3-hydroxylacyl-ACP dehydratase [Acinetobacter sp. ANC 4648]|uniref:ApeP family dehydratase n=1 Tax=Acinetobacter sp. ANC 4648 TaxID=1977875 RepID=UPI000A34AE7E|nr:3-hydroxylacyl-ACP dehydratase [Acinetobacter sp. ANC 4648]OTG84735.1 3-hydroxylacyl-ACP dehydratase [Acinetobacter sp. ANC 4648]